MHQDLRRTTPLPEPALPLAASLRKASAFLLSRQAIDGMWRDFTTPSGKSTTWLTAVVVSRVGSILPPRAVRKSVAAFRASERPGGWGWSADLPTDCEATLHVAQVFSLSGRQRGSGERALSIALGYQAADGGFRSLREEELLAASRGVTRERCRGWLGSHVCISAMALETLFSIPGFSRFRGSPAVAGLFRFLLSHQSPEGFWTPYWWRSRYTATASVVRCTEALQRTPLEAAAGRGRAWLLATRHRDGFWTNGYDGLPCLLSTAEALRALLRSGSRPEEERPTIEWLLANQLPDGSWRSQPCMQVPAPWVENPAVERDDCIADDERVYSTAAAMAALLTAQECLERSGAAARRDAS